MTQKAGKISSARLGRPALKPGSPKRSSFNTRLRADTKEALEAEAKISGRSLSEEIEFRLEQSLRDKATQIEALGGEDTYEILRLLGSVAKIIKWKNENSATDWKTGLAISYAWKRLIRDWLPKTPDEWAAETNALWDDLPDAPARPARPEEPKPRPSGLFDKPPSVEEVEAYREELQGFEKNLINYNKAMIKLEEFMEQRESALREKTVEINKAVGVGQDALGLLSDPNIRS